MADNKFEARQVADMTNTLANLKPGDQLTHQEIQILAKVNADSIKEMRKSLEVERDTKYKHFTQEEQKQHDVYWQTQIKELDDMVNKYNGNLAQIKLGATSDLKALEEAHKTIENLKGTILAPAAAPASTTAPAAPKVVASTTPASAVEKKAREDIISPQEFAKIEKFLGEKTDTTVTVQKNAKQIADLLKSSPRLEDVKVVLGNLIKWDPKDFQKALKRPQDGIIGSGDIVALLTQSGVPDDKMPTEIKNMKGKEKKGGKKVVKLASAVAPKAVASAPAAPAVVPPASAKAAASAAAPETDIAQIKDKIILANDIKLGKVKDLGNGRYDLDVYYHSRSASLHEYSMIPTKQIVITADELKKGNKVWPGVEFRVNLQGTEDWYLKGLGQTGNIVLKDGVLHIDLIVDSDSAVKEIPVTNVEQIAVTTAMREVKKINPLSSINRNGSFYSGKNIMAIDYALLKQSDGEFFLYDKPSSINVRNVFRLNTEQVVIGSMTIDQNNNLTNTKGQKMNGVTYFVPPPVQIKK